MSKIDARLKDLGIEPAHPRPRRWRRLCALGVIAGNLAFISGQVTMKDGTPQYIGKLGDKISVEDGKAAARLCAINVLAVLKLACGGDLERVARCVKVGVFVNAVPDYAQQPEVANGASDLFVAVFGDPGKHARAAVGVGALPRGVAVEVEAVFETCGFAVTRALVLSQAPPKSAPSAGIRLPIRKGWPSRTLSRPTNSSPHWNSPAPPRGAPAGRRRICCSTIIPG